MKYFVLMIVMMLLFGCGSSTTGEDSAESVTFSAPPNPYQTVTVTGSTVNLRQGPGTLYAVVGSAHAGDTLMVTGEAPDWYRVYIPEKSLFAWIYAGLTSGAVMPQ
ncbi:MAG: SH3 domain-containing protein [Candidatus Fermentibacteraceae bacterium]|nr:SH3 domain-containing protein [Candidatus Fermentibacteraceae bacterium]